MTCFAAAFLSIESEQIDDHIRAHAATQRIAASVGLMTRGDPGRRFRGRRYSSSTTGLMARSAATTASGSTERWGSLPTTKYACFSSATR